MMLVFTYVGVYFSILRVTPILSVVSWVIYLQHKIV